MSRCLVVSLIVLICPCIACFSFMFSGQFVETGLCQIEISCYGPVLVGCFNVLAIAAVHF